MVGRIYGRTDRNVLYNNRRVFFFFLLRKERVGLVQGGAEPTDTFQMVIDNIWKQGKICETVYKYVQVCYLLPTDYKLIF